MALIPPYFLDCVVAIGADTSDGSRRWIASGFLYACRVNPGEEPKLHRPYLVTNRHVFEGLGRAYLRFNPQTAGSAREYALDLLHDGLPSWTGHPNASIDIAVLPINTNLLAADGIQFACFESDYDGATLEKLSALGISEGDFAYTLGFPMGIVGGERSTVIVRSGIIARIRDTLAGINEQFLLDSFVFPGNSGGPVVTKPESMAIRGTKSQKAAYLIGIVQSYVPYDEVAVSQQTGKARVVFQENSGLSFVYPVDFIEQVIAAHLAGLQEVQSMII